VGLKINAKEEKALSQNISAGRREAKPAVPAQFAVLCKSPPKEHQ